VSGSGSGNTIHDARAWRTDTTIEEQRQKIRSVLAQDNQTILVVEQDDRLVGFPGAYGGSFQRNRHAAYIVIGILQAYAGQGIGKELWVFNK